MKMRFCNSCQQSKPEEGGYRKEGSLRGWRCAGCYNRTTPSIYRANRPTDPKFLGDVKKILGY
jgi:hypothetical protein